MSPIPSKQQILVFEKILRSSPFISIRDRMVWRLIVSNFTLDQMKTLVGLLLEDPNLLFNLNKNLNTKLTLMRMQDQKLKEFIDQEIEEIKQIK